MWNISTRPAKKNPVYFLDKKKLHDNFKMKLKGTLYNFDINASSSGFIYNQGF